MKNYAGFHSHHLTYYELQLSAGRFSLSARSALYLVVFLDTSLDIIMASTITDLLSVQQTAPNVFESVYNPEKMGNMANIAYGGNTLAVAVDAALQTTPVGFFLYSALGNYHGPAFTNCKLQRVVRKVRTTKTFATRHVEISQPQKDGKERPCLFLTADFQIAEPATLLTYSRLPRMTYTAVEDCATVDENR